MSLLDQAVAELGTEIEVRHPARNDVVPSELKLGFKMLDPEWAWLVVSHGAIVGALVAAPCHGMVFVARLAVVPDFGWTLPRLFRTFIRECGDRSFQGYFTFLDPARKEENKLLRILKRAGCSITPTSHLCAGGKLSDLEKW